MPPAVWSRAEFAGGRNASNLQIVCRNIRSANSLTRFYQVASMEGLGQFDAMRWLFGGAATGRSVSSEDLSLRLAAKLGMTALGLGSLRATALDVLASTASRSAAPRSRPPCRASVEEVVRNRHPTARPGNDRITGRRGPLL